MSKDSHFTGQPVYSQVLKLLDKEKILKISRETKGSEAYVKCFDGYRHIVVMLFGILKHFDSLRELEIGMKAEALRRISSDTSVWTIWSGVVRWQRQTYDAPRSSLQVYTHTFWRSTPGF